MERSSVAGVIGEQQGDASGRHENGTITLHYHGSCSSCHHFHRHVGFDVPIDDTEPTRFHCERCQHPIFGLGRTDTQITLASQDSFPLVDGTVDLSSTTACCDNQPNGQPHLQLLTSLPHPTQNSLLGQLSAIDEGTSPAEPSVTTIETQEEALTTSDNNVVIPADSLVDPTVNPTVLYPTEFPSRKAPADPGQDNHQRKPMMLRYLYDILGKLARRICGRSRQFRFFGFALRVHLTSDYLWDNGTLSCHTGELNTRIANLSAVQSCHSPRNQEAETLPADPIDGCSGSSSRLVSHSNLCQAGNSDVISEHQDAALNVKQERIRNYRRDQTLRKQALQNRCNCTEDCPCKMIMAGFTTSALSVRSNGLPYESATGYTPMPGHHQDRAERRTSPTNNTHHSGRHQRANSLNYLGESIFMDHRPPWYSSSLASNNHLRRNEATATESNASSLSLSPSRPTLPRRSVSASELSLSSASGLSRSVANVLQDLVILRQARLSSAVPSSFPWLHNGIAAHDADLHFDPPSIHSLDSNNASPRPALSAISN